MSNNKIISREIEDLIASMVNGKVIDRKYDIETATHLIEVKSCSLVVRNRNNRYISHLRQGGFWVNQRNHRKLLDTAKKKDKIPIYILCVRYIDQKLFCWKTARQVSCLLTGKNNILKIPIINGLKNGKKMENLK